MAVSAARLGWSGGGRSGEGEEHLVEGGLAQAEVFDGDAGFGQRTGHVHHRPNPQAGGDRDRTGGGVDGRFGAGEVGEDVGGVGHPGGVDDHDVDLVAADLALERPGIALGDDGPVVDDHDVVGEALGLVQVLGGEHDGGARLDQRVEHRPQLETGPGVEAGGGLVEEQHLGPGDERGGQVEPAPHSPGVAGHDPVGGLGQAEVCRGVPRPAVAASRRPSWCSSPSMTRFSRPVRSGSTVASWAASPIRRRTSAAWVRTSKPATFARPSSASDRVVRMRTAVVFPAPLGPRTAVTVPVGHVEVDPAQGGGRSVSLHQPARFDSGGVHRHGRLLTERSWGCGS